MMSPPPLRTYASSAGRCGVDVLQDHRVEARQVLREELVDRERDQRELRVGGVHVVVVRAQDEERHQIDRLVALQPHAERPHVVGGAPRDVQQAHALAGHAERHDALIVLRHFVAARGLDADLDDARAGAVERDRQLHRGLAVPNLCLAARELRGRLSAPELPHHHGHLVAREATRAADHDPERERLMRDGRARSPDVADAGVRRRVLRHREGVDLGAQRLRQPLERGVVALRRRLREAPVAHHHDRLRALALRRRERVQRRGEIALLTVREPRGLLGAGHEGAESFILERVVRDARPLPLFAELARCPERRVPARPAVRLEQHAP
jgi:hypothetical protein